MKECANQKFRCKKAFFSAVDAEKRSESEYYYDAKGWMKRESGEMRAILGPRALPNGLLPLSFAAITPTIYVQIERRLLLLLSHLRRGRF